MKIVTKIRLMRLTLLTLRGLWPWMRIIVLNVNVQEGFSTPMDQDLVRLHEIMVEITTECTTSVGIKLCDHVTSLFLRNWIKHSPLSFGLSQQIHAPGNGISLDG